MMAKKKDRFILGGILSVCSIIIIPHVNANVVQNNSFEDSVNTGGDATRIDSPDATSLPFWELTTGSIDILHNFASDGTQSVKLIGPTTVQQVISVVPGTSYDFSFDFAVDDPNGFGELEATIFEEGRNIASCSVGGLGDPPGIFGTDFSLDGIDAQSNEWTVVFESSGNSDFNGPIIDNVAVIPIPPAGILLGSGLLAIISISRRKKTV
jgi:hypothetical protein